MINYKDSRPRVSDATNPNGSSNITIGTEFDSAMAYLKEINFIEENSRGGYININNSIIKHCVRMGDYLFNTDYCKQSFEENTHYFGDSNSFEHSQAFKQRKKFNNKGLN